MNELYVDGSGYDIEFYEQDMSSGCMIPQESPFECNVQAGPKHTVEVER